MKVNAQGLYDLPTDKAAKDRGYEIDLTIANNIIDFASKRCKLTSDDYSGQGTRPLVLLPWQQAFIRTAYGWRHKETKQLRYKDCWVFCPRRQGKSVLLSLLATYTAVRKKRCDIPIIASSAKEAGIIFGRIRDFIDKNQYLSNQFWTRENKDLIQNQKTDAKIHLLSNSVFGKSGQSVQLALFDEYASWGCHARLITDRLHDARKDKLNALAITITTPQFDLSHIAYEKYRHCVNILDGKAEDIWTLPVVYSAPDNWRDNVEAAVRQACPAVDQTVPMSAYLDEYEQIQDKPLELSRYETMNLGRWVGSPEIWIPHPIWQATYTDRKESEFYGRPAVIGVDYGASYDLTALCVTVEDNGTHYVYPRFFLPEAIARKRQETDNVPYLEWAKQGLITLTSGDVVDTSVLEQQIKDISTTFNVVDIRYDKTRLEGMRQNLLRAGYDRMTAVTQQGQTMQAAFGMMQRLIEERKYKTPDNAVSNWCMNNARPKRNKQGHLLIEKSGDYNKIDYIDAAAMSLTYWIDDKKPDLTVCPEGQRWIGW